MKNNKRSPLFYPDLGSKVDLWFLRLGGHGLGNAFYVYFHAVVLAEKHHGTIIAPTWFSFTLGPFLKKESSKRLYWRIFKPFPGEISNFSKLLVLAKNITKRKILEIGVHTGAITNTGLNVVACQDFTFTFAGLHAYRDIIRHRLLGIMKDPIPVNHNWGKSGFIAVHVRLGDFTSSNSDDTISTERNNARIPMSWYVSIIQGLQKCFPTMPVRIFSDGKDHELQPLLALGAKVYRSGSDITDLLALSSSSILVGSNSTYSKWAVFLGNMPSIWLERKVAEEKPSDQNTPLLLVPIVHPHQISHLIQCWANIDPCLSENKCRAT